MRIIQGKGPACGCPALQYPSVVLSPLDVLGSLAENRLTIYARLLGFFFSGILILFHCLYVLGQYHTFNNCTFVMSSELGSVSLPALFFFKIVLAFWDPLQFHMNLRISFSISGEKAVRVSIGIVLNVDRVVLAS